MKWTGNHYGIIVGADESFEDNFQSLSQAIAKEDILHFGRRNPVNSSNILTHILSDKVEAKARRIAANANHLLKNASSTSSSIFMQAFIVHPWIECLCKNLAVECTEPKGRLLLIEKKFMILLRWFGFQGIKIGALPRQSKLDYSHHHFINQLVMILNKISTSILRTASPRFAYISKKALDQIEQSHGKSFFQKALMYSKQARLIGKQGFIGIKKDLQEYKRLYTKQKIEKGTLTKEEEQTKRKVIQQLSKFKYIIGINILPFSPPLLLFFILTYPSKVPSYFCLDTLHQSHQLQSIQRQKQSIQHFKANPLDPQTFSVSSCSLEELKQISLLLFGDYEDGVVGINKYFKDKPKRHFIHPHISRRIVLGKLRKQFKKSTYQNMELTNFTLEQFILWKYQRIMKGEDLLIYRPIEKAQDEQANSKTQEKPKDDGPSENK